MHRPVSFAALVAAALPLLACPAPALAGAWTLPAGRQWLRVGLMYQHTGERYFLTGERIPYFFEGENRTTAAFIDFRRAVGDRAEIGVQVPVFRIEFDDLAAERTSAGIGDVRLGFKQNLLKAPLVVSVGSTVKFPTGKFENDAEVVPVGEGQYDVEITGEVGRSLWPRPGYVTGLVGYRFRTKNETTGIDFGDELLWNVEGGYRIRRRLMVKAVVRGLYGFRTTSFGLPIPSLRREAVHVQPGVVLDLATGRGIEIQVPFTVRGRNWPAGPVVSVGFFQTF